MRKGRELPGFGREAVSQPGFLCARLRGRMCAHNINRWPPKKQFCFLAGHGPCFFSAMALFFPGTSKAVFCCQLAIINHQSSIVSRQVRWSAGCASRQFVNQFMKLSNELNHRRRSRQVGRAGTRPTCRPAVNIKNTVHATNILHTEEG